MNEAPEKIWAGGREPEWFFDDPSDHRDGGYKEYTLTDIANARVAKLEDLLGRYADQVGKLNGVYFELDGPEGDYIIDIAKRTALKENIA